MQRLIILLPFLYRTLAYKEDHETTSPHIIPITDFTIQAQDPNNIRIQNTEPVVKRAIEPNTYQEYFEWQLENWGLNEHYDVQPETALQYVVFFSNGGSTGDAVPFIRLAEKFAALKIHNLQVILYIKQFYINHKPRRDDIMFISDMNALLDLNIIPVFVVMSQAFVDFWSLNVRSEVRRYYARLNKLNSEDYPENQFHLGLKRIIFLDLFWFSESRRESLVQAFQSIVEKRDLAEILEEYSTSPASRKQHHISEIGYMELRSATIELLNSQDLANSPSWYRQLTPSIHATGIHFPKNGTTTGFPALGKVHA